MNDPSRRVATMATSAKAAFTPRRIGRAITVAAVVAALACLLGDLRDRSTASLQLVERTLTNVDESLLVARDVASSVGGTLDTLRESLGTLSTGVVDGAAAIDVVANLTEDIPPALDRLDGTLADMHAAAGTIDGALAALEQLPLGPDLDLTVGLAASVDGVRGDLRPIADDLRDSTAALRDLAGSSGDLVDQLATLDADLAHLDSSLARSAELIDSYRADTASARALARDSLDDLGRDIALARVLALVLAGAIAVGQLAPFHIGRELAKRRTETDRGASDGRSTDPRPVSEADRPPE